MQPSLLATSIAALIIGAAGAASAQDHRPSFAIGPEAGTVGVGVQVQVSTSDRLSFRASGDWAQINRNKGYGDVAYNGRLKSATGGAFIDYHPAGNAFFVSGGAYFGRRHVEILGRPTQPVKIGGAIFTPEQLGVLTGDIKMSDTQPFVGVGYDSTFHSSGPWGVHALAGISVSDAPSVSLLASGGLISNDPTTIARVKQEEASIQNKVRNFRYYPIVQVSITRRF